MTIMTVNESLAKIAINKNVLREYVAESFKRVVYMDDNTEFQIQLFNPYTYTIGIKISLNGQDISDSHLVLKPGERVWLDRYFDKNVKFKFSTYTVEDSHEAKKAIANNGTVVIKFFRELKKREYSNINISRSEWDSPKFPWDNGIIYCETPSSHNILYSSSTGDTLRCKSSLQEVKTYTSSTIETGRIEEGGYSNQEFGTVYTTFESWSFLSEQINILPSSRKIITKSDTLKRYCVECGRKIKEKFKYCPFCGTRQ